MSLFEIITITLSVILGLSMSRMLWSMVASIRARDDVQLHWLPYLWAACIFMQHAFYWFAIYAIDLEIEYWSWTWILQLLLLAILLFAAGALILPSELERVDDLRQDFQKHGRLALIPLAAYQLLWIPTNLRVVDQVSLEHIFSPVNWFNIVLLVFIAAGFRANKIFVHAAAVLLYFSAVMWAQIMVWAPYAF